MVHFVMRVLFLNQILQKL